MSLQPVGMHLLNGATFQRVQGIDPVHDILVSWVLDDDGSVLGANGERVLQKRRQGQNVIDV